MRPFEYVEPGTLEEAADLLAQDPVGSRPIAGGTDLIAEV
ncbi:MAG: FAD binding domain-containing protein [Chloroflexi bacterium]|nr:FAD binding domain-containing protein [Chloroflexota bacterium]